MNKLIKISTVALAFSALFVGCVKETMPTNYITSEQAAESDKISDGMFNAIPQSMVAVGGFSDNAAHYDFAYPAIMLATDALAAEVILTSSDGMSGYDWFAHFSTAQALSPNYFGPALFWINYYSFIKSANSIISDFSAMEQTPDVQASIAAAKIYRALYYLDMARLYDPFKNDYTDVASVEALTVPIIDENTTEEQARNNPRATRDEMFEFIFSDLDSAIELYSAEGVQSPGSGIKPSLAVAYGLKARAYLWLGGFDKANYALAAENARMAITGSKATIMSKGEWTSPKNGFNTPNGSWMWYLPQSADQCSNLINYVAWMSGEASWGYGAMVQYGLRNEYYDRLGADDFRKRVVKGPEDIYSKCKEYTNAPDAATFDAYAPYMNMKFRPVGGTIDDFTNGNPTSVVTMRVEEMYLIEAEAIAHADAAKGKALLAEFMAKRDLSYMCTAITTDEVVEEIIFQKKIELWGEGVILYDLKRLGYGIHTAYEGTNVCTDYRFDVDGIAPWWNMCIPESETQLNTAIVNNPNPSELVKPVKLEE